jgi:4-hydroxythreonine-4-phosphate dehydrogenase
MNSSAKPRVAVTMGDPAGVGPEICLDLLVHGPTCALCQPLVFGDRVVLERAAAATGKPVPSQCLTWEQWQANPAAVEGPAVIDFGAIASAELEPGKVHAGTGRAAYRYIEAAIQAALAGQVGAVATGPIHKEALHAAGVPYPGHTEIFAALTQAKHTCMMLTSPQITCSFVTTHVGYRDVPGLLSVARILEVIELTAAAMERLRGRKPRLLVNGLNPHAGENGLFGGGEEEQFIIPAITQARARGIDLIGPLSPDTAFLPQRLKETDAYICMYHDQGHIPLKMLAFDTVINTTLGLPIIRTSVGHGTALDIAWQGKARSSSLCSAVEMAARLAAPASGKAAGGGGA